MREVDYLCLFMEGFASFAKPSKFVLDRPGMNLIGGSNGAGKSTILNALIWCEFGKTLKGSVPTWPDVQPDSFRGTRVIVDRRIGSSYYRVARHLKFKGTTLGYKGDNSLLIFKSDTGKFKSEDLLGDALHKSDQQQLILDQLGLDYTQFLNSVVFGQNMPSLVHLSNTDKRKLFSTLVDVGFVDAAKEKAALRKSELEKECDAILNTQNSLQTQIEHKEEHIKSQEALVSSFEFTKQERISELTTIIDGINRGINMHLAEETRLSGLLTTMSADNLEDQEGVVERYKEEVNKASGYTKELRASIRDLELKISKTKQDISDNEYALSNPETHCDKCGSELDKSTISTFVTTTKKSISKDKTVLVSLEAVLEETQTKLNKAELDLDNATGQYALAKGDLVTLKEEVKNLVKISTDHAKTKAKLESLVESLDLRSKELEQVTNSKPPVIDLKSHRNDLKALKKDLEACYTSLDPLSQEIEYLSWWIKNGFGASGLKAFMFNSLLHSVNSYISKYADMLGYRVEFSVDLTKASKPFKTLVYSGDVVRDYDDLSGGQKQRIDVCIAFAMNDLVRVNTKVNLLVMDEFTTGLDQDGLEVFFELLRQKAGNKSVYVISHLNNVDSMSCRFINVSLDSELHSVIS